MRRLHDKDTCKFIRSRKLCQADVSRIAKKEKRGNCFLETFTQLTIVLFFDVGRETYNYYVHS